MPQLTGLVLDGQQRNRGFELTAFGEVRPDLRLLGGFTYLDSKLTRTQGGRFDGKDVTGVPELTAVLSLEYDTAVFPGLTLTARAEHVGSRFVRTDNSLKIPAYQLYGLGARYQRTLGDKAFTLRLNINNLLGEDYWIAWPGANNRAFPRRAQKHKFVIHDGFLRPACHSPFPPTPTLPPPGGGRV